MEKHLDNALQNYLDNYSYLDKIMLGYYTYILIPKLPCVLTYLCSIQ